MYMTVKKIYIELCRIGGSKVAFEMHKRYEGEAVNVSGRKSKFVMALEELTDKETADAFHKKYKSQISWYIGKIDRLTVNERNAKMIADYKNGTTPAVLAKKYHLCTPYIKKLVSYVPKYPLRYNKARKA